MKPWSHKWLGQTGTKGTTGREKWSPGNDARVENLTILINGIYTNQNLTRVMQTCCLSNSSEKPSVNVSVKTFNCRIDDFAVSANHWIKLKESEKKDKYLDLTRELEKTVEHESHGYTNCRRCSWYSHQRFGKELEDLEIRGRVETIQTRALLRSARILRRVL